MVQLLCGMRNLPRPGIDPMSPVLTGGFFTTGPPGKFYNHILKIISKWCFMFMFYGFMLYVYDADSISCDMIKFSYRLNTFIHWETFRMLPVLAMANSATMNMWLQVSLPDTDLILFKYIPRGEIAESCGSSIFNFWGGFHTVFHNGYASLHSHQHHTRVSFSLHPCQCLLSLVFLIIACFFKSNYS